MKLNKDENQNIEFKQAWRDEYLKWICAFSNTEGGTLYIGVRDDGEILGIEDSHKLSEDIPNKIRNSMGLICQVNLLSVDDKKYFQIIVEKYPFPVSYHGKYYKRSGSTLQELTGVELDKMILFVQGRTWDSIPVPYVKVEDLDNDSIKLFKNHSLDRGRMDKDSLNVSNEILLKNLRMFENEYLTRAAVMCFHSDPEKWVNGAFIKVAFFENEANILYQDEIHGSLIKQVENTLELIYTKYMKALIDYPDKIHRTETFFFPRGAFRELLLNAVVHRDYMNPTPIQIKIYKDKIRIWNIGKFPEEIKIESLFEEHASVRRNPNIANVFFKGGYIESWGRGYKNIVEECNLLNAKIPEPEENSGGVAVNCLASEKYIELARKFSVDSFGEGSKKADCPVNCPVNCPVIAQRTYLAIKENPNFSVSELSKRLEISERTVKNHQKLLKEVNLIERIGADKNGSWKIKNAELGK